MRRGSLQHGAAVFLLLLVCIEAFCPRPCSEPAGGFTAGRGAPALAGSTAHGSPVTPVAALAAERDGRPQSPAPEPGSDDCFCCARITPVSSAPVIFTAERIPPPSPAPDDFLPSPPLPSAFHPPRAA